MAKDAPMSPVSTTRGKQEPAKRTVYVLTVRPPAGGDDVRALRWIIKRLLRPFGWRCVSIEARQ
jgi:hypothetical protein